MENVISLGGCPEKMMLGMGSYGKTYTLADANSHGIGATTIASGNAGPITAEPVSLLTLEC